MKPAVPKPRSDVHTPQVRSYNMSRIRGRDTRPELLIRRGLHARGYRYRLHDKGLPGLPDMVFSKRRAVLFVHGLLLAWPRLPAVSHAGNPYGFLGNKDRYKQIKGREGPRSFIRRWLASSHHMGVLFARC
jgi:hypothetical protein